ncbi:Ig-like domain-containing protein [Streptomyces cocklensis]|uniref:Lipoprotein-anchoring transpeptidase ErfK/SrfK n=1 Tax=Actinacidiphila cocklensis TaxID=887465 RepID=A0A9W4DT34_9ACTN|nr:Ig-like domain-containing protein [Actinacidiphila cocklensis]MDD1063073.1 Ig-like domain-containing protein [Actinacidiphila cocklensis]CAG6395509.1 Lipoprotein-anchoring transpeptidase ErfK/SrfK [Actinacidiphila cocklensis]
MTSPENGSAPAKHPKVTKRRTLAAAAAVLIAGSVALTACNSGGGGHADSKASASPSPSTQTPTPTQTPSPLTQASQDAAAAKHASAAKITITPKTGATGAKVSGAVKVSVTGGTLTSVTMTSKSTGHAVAGKLSADKKSWTPSGSLAHSTQYAISAAAVDAQGQPAAATSGFGTAAAKPSNFVGYFTPEDGSTVGVGMPVSVKFDHAISKADRAAVQRGVTVTSSSGQQVVGHWFNAKRLDLRPQTYWVAGSHVTLDLNLKGVKGAPGVYGVQDKTVGFDVGRSQVSTVDTKTHMMTVVRDGQVVNTIPISAGGKGHTTYDGQMVIEEKDQTTRMNGATVGFTDADGKGEYDIPDVPHAMRLSDSGTFIHGNYWGDPSVFGTTNTSHGCIGIEDVKGGKDPSTDAAWFYDNSLIGDVVTVVNSPDKVIQPSNGLNGWNMTWSQWVAGSAL